MSQNSFTIDVITFIFLSPDENTLAITKTRF
jgi:hypothetical protein